MFPEYAFPCLIVGDFNIHNSLSDPLHDFSPNDIVVSAYYYELAADMGFSLLNTSGVFTRFPFVAGDRPAVLDLSFANTELAPFVTSWSTHLPSIESNHIPILLVFSAPPLCPSAVSPNREMTDWTILTPALQQVRIPAPPPLPTKTSLYWHGSTEICLWLQPYSPYTLCRNALLCTRNSGGQRHYLGSAKTFTRRKGCLEESTPLTYSQNPIPVI